MEDLLTLNSSIVYRMPKKGWQDGLAVPEDCVYPDHYEFMVNLPEVGTIKVRPIRPEDSAKFENFFYELSPRSIYMRFFTFLNQLPTRMLERFVHVDYDKEIALIALLQEGLSEKIIGDARVVELPPGDRGEFSVIINDSLQGKGVGALLLRHCFSIAQARGFAHIHGVVLTENRQMLALGRKMKFSIKHVAGTSEYKLSKDLE